MAYEKPERFPCPFCECISGRIPSAIVFENEHAVSFMAVNRRSKGAVLVSPKRHVEQLSHLKPEEAVGVMEVLQKTAKSVCLAYEPSAFHTFCNAGIRAGQSVCHMHFQIQTRFDDTEYSFAPSIEIPWIPVDELRKNAQRIQSVTSDINHFQPKFELKDQKMEEFTQPLDDLRAQGVVIEETPCFYAVIPEYARAEGALVVLPKRPVENYLALSEPERSELIQLVSRLADTLEKAYDPIGLSVWSETGVKADQHFDHLVVEMTPYAQGTDYKYQDRSQLNKVALSERQSWTQHIIKHLEPGQCMEIG
ncbi:HIT family protein [Vibrio mangrovi]|uniref:HIT domain protein n=1 Tax=Vibrio mangrovi TaxID=474394 RepID=A0A1Y6IQ38_9VIBR|nr:HIT family protein [Vibrio mangrovi]MDW6003463.1 HIT family protein [Vibrio mangrovi]SMR99746.1 HIT domain protein [Vibrio mangrovi]